MMNKQKNSMNTAGMPGWVKLVSAVLIIGLTAAGVFNVVHYMTQRQQLSAVQAKTVSLENKLNKTVRATPNTQYVFDTDGKLDDGAQATVVKLNKLFTDITTFKSGAEYTANRKAAHDYVKDPDFFKTFLSADDDSTGHSKIDGLTLKSEPASVQTYYLAPGQYYVVVSYYMYHHKGDLNQLSKLATTTTAFKVAGNKHQLDKVSVVDGFGLVAD